MDAAHWQQGLGLMMPMENQTLMGAGTNQVQGSNPSPPAPPPPGHGAGAGGTEAERRARPQKERALNCPRCNSTNTKFCYYNNYSLQQPRYFCKTCRRYWTEGGSLRNVPVGGGSRKNKRSSSSSAAAAAASASTSASVTSSSMGSASRSPKLAREGAHDLNLAFPHHGGLQAHVNYMAFPSLEGGSLCNSGGTTASNGPGIGSAGPALGTLSAMELLRSTGCYMPPQVPMHLPGEFTAAGFSLGDFRPPPPAPTQPQSLLGFSLDAHGPAATGAPATAHGSSAGLQATQERAGSRLPFPFPFQDLKPTGSSGGESGGSGVAGVDGGAVHQFEQGKEQGSRGTPDAPAFWNGITGGAGTSW